MSLIYAFTIMCAVYVFGLIIGTLTKGRIGSALVTVPVMLVLFWTGLIDADTVQASNLPAVYAIVNCLLLVNLGTTLDFTQLRKDLKLVAISLGGLAGCALLTLVSGSLLFGRTFAFLSFPSLAGGIISTNLMYQRAMELDLVELAASVMLVMSVQPWIGMPAISFAVSSESKKLLKEYRAGNGGDTQEKQDQKQPVPDRGTSKKLLFDMLPARFRTPLMHIFLCALFSALAAFITGYTSPATSGIIGTAIVGIAVGLLARRAGFISRDPLSQAGVMPFFMFALIMSMRASLASLTPSGFAAILGPIVGIVVLGGIGIFAGAFICSRIFKRPFAVAAAAAFGAYAGYPVNYQVAMEAIEAQAETPEEFQFLKDRIIPVVTIGSVVSVSICSIIIASIFVGLV